MEIKANNAEVTINLNRYIKFRCKEEGYQRMADYHNQLLGIFPSRVKRQKKYYKALADEGNGWLKLQIHSFLKQFGGDTRIDNLIYLDVIFLEG